MTFRAASYQQKLEDAGVDHKIAQAHASAMEDFVVSDLVTKDYLDASLESRDAQLDARFSQLDAKFADLELRLVRWIVGSAGIVLAIIKFTGS